MKGKGSSDVSALALNSALFPLSFYLVCLAHTHIHIMYVYIPNLCIYIYTLSVNKCFNPD